MNYYFFFTFFLFLFLIPNIFTTANIPTDKNNLSLSIKKGEKISEILGKVSNITGNNIICAIDHIFASDILLENISYPIFLEYICKLYNLKHKNINNTTIVENRKSDKKYWHYYYFKYPDYIYKSITEINQEQNSYNQYYIDNTTNNKEFNLHLTKIINVWGDLQNTFDKMNIKAILNKHCGLVSVYGTKDEHNTVKTFLNYLKKELYTVINIKIIIWKRNKTDKAHKTPTSMYDSAQEKNLNSFRYSELDIKLHRNSQGRNIISHETRLSTLNNQPVCFQDKRERTFFFQKKYVGNQKHNNFSIESREYAKFQSGTSLYIHPLYDRGKFIVYFFPISIDRKRQGQGNDFIKQSLSSYFISKPGEEVLLGGFITYSYTKIKKFIPVISKIPLIGVLFSYNVRSKMKHEMMISSILTLKKN